MVKLQEAAFFFQIIIFMFICFGSQSCRLFQILRKQLKFQQPQFHQSKAGSGIIWRREEKRGEEEEQKEAAKGGHFITRSSLGEFVNLT